MFLQHKRFCRGSTHEKQWPVLIIDVARTESSRQRFADRATRTTYLALAAAYSSILCAIVEQTKRKTKHTYTQFLPCRNLSRGAC